MNKKLIKRMITYLKKYRQDFAWDANMARLDPNAPQMMKNRLIAYEQVSECIEDLERMLDENRRVEKQD